MGMPELSAGDKLPGVLPMVFQQAVAQADIAISITDARGVILFVNPAFSRVTGYEAAEAIGRNESILSNKTTPSEVYKTLWQRISRGMAWNGTLVNRRKDGTRYLAELVITPVLDAGGAVVNYLGMHRDITEVHRLACEVRNQKALIESVVDAAPIVIALLDAADRVVLDNHEYKKLQADLGMAEPAPLLMAAVRSALAQEVQAAAQPDPRRAGYLFLDREVRIDRPGAKGPLWFSCSATAVSEADTGADNFFAGARRDYVLLLAKDITGLRMQQEKARMAALRAMLAEEDRASALRESLSAAVFQLEGPLNMVASAVHMLTRRQGASPGDPMAAALADAVRTGEAALANLRAMIPHRVAEAAGPVNLNEVLRDVLDVSTQRLLGAGISVTWQPQAILPALQGHPNKLRAMFKALVDNAIDAMSGRGWRERELSVATRVAGESIEALVEDSGPGVPAGDQLKVFEPFYTTRRGSGAGGHLGTGLSGAQQIAADHGGSISIDAAHVPGCRVRVELPVQRR